MKRPSLSIDRIPYKCMIQSVEFHNSCIQYNKLIRAIVLLGQNGSIFVSNPLFGATRPNIGSCFFLCKPSLPTRINLMTQNSVSKLVMGV